MKSMNDYINEYTNQLKKGHIQKAYKGILSFMSGLKTYLEKRHTDYTSGALYFGYMDMTYFSFTPLALREKSLKIGVVYLHEENRFEVWLAGSNRRIQAEYIEKMRYMDLREYWLSEIKPGVDSIISRQIVEQPDFDQPEDLMQIIESKTIEFIEDVLEMIFKMD